MHRTISVQRWMLVAFCEVCAFVAFCAFCGFWSVAFCAFGTHSPSKWGLPGRFRGAQERAKTQPKGVEEQLFRTMGWEGPEEGIVHDKMKRASGGFRLRWHIEIVPTAT